jgi:hypothetical protein
MALNALLIRGQTTYSIKFLDADNAVIFNCASGKTKDEAIDNMVKCAAAAAVGNSFTLYTSGKKKIVNRQRLSDGNRIVGSTKAHAVVFQCNTWRDYIIQEISSINRLNF